MANPKISVITTTYNRYKGLERAIKSVQSQTFEDYEHIIVDDASSDRTKNIAEQYAKQDKRIKYIRRDDNYGNHTRPKNEGIKASKGEYIAYLDDDNQYLPTFLENNLTELQLSSYDVVYSDMRMFKHKPDGTEEDLGKGIAMHYDPQLLMNRNYIDTNMVLHKKEAVLRVGGWDETLPRFADWNLFVRMTKAGISFKRIPIYQTKYFLTDDNSAAKHPVKQWTDPETGLNMFDPTWFSPTGCYIWGPWLGGSEIEPTVAIFTITYDRLEYTKRMWETMLHSTEYPFDWYVWDNGSSDDTPKWLKEMEEKEDIGLTLSPENRGLTYASNMLVEEILDNKYDIAIKVDNDCEFLTKGWLEDFVDLWKRNHKLYIGPYPEGLVDHPGGAPRVGSSTIGEEFVEVVNHLSGICAFVETQAYRNFRWRDEFYHGNQDAEASKAFIEQGYMPMILPKHRIRHMDTTAGQYEKFPEYFERRKKEKTTKVERDYQQIQEQESAHSENTIWGKRVVESVNRYGDWLTGKVLDIGCNDGMAMEALQKLSEVTEVSGIDIDPNKVEKAVKKGLKASEGRLEELPYKDKEFDTVFCSHTFEHAEDGKKAAEEIMRIAKRAVIIVPIEEQTDNAAHYNQIKSPEALKEFFPGAKVLKEENPNRLEWEYVAVLDFP